MSKNDTNKIDGFCETYKDGVKPNDVGCAVASDCASGFCESPHKQGQKCNEKGPGCACQPLPSNAPTGPATHSCDTCVVHQPNDTWTLYGPWPTKETIELAVASEDNTNVDCSSLPKGRCMFRASRSECAYTCGKLNEGGEEWCDYMVYDHDDKGGFCEFFKNGNCPIGDPCNGKTAKELGLKDSSELYARNTDDCLKYSVIRP